MADVKLACGALFCPSCGNDGDLHQTSARVGFRRNEDETESLVVCADEHCSWSEVAPIRGRRHQISIWFDCWNCSKRSELTITQHKGQTLIRWED